MPSGFQTWEYDDGAEEIADAVANALGLKVTVEYISISTAQPRKR